MMFTLMSADGFKTGRVKPKVGHILRENVLSFKNPTQVHCHPVIQERFSKIGSTYSHTLETHYLRWKDLPQKIHQGSNTGMKRKPTKLKDKEDSFMNN